MPPSFARALIPTRPASCTPTSEFAAAVRAALPAESPTPRWAPLAAARGPGRRTGLYPPERQCPPPAADSSCGIGCSSARRSSRSGRVCIPATCDLRMRRLIGLRRCRTQRRSAGTWAGTRRLALRAVAGNSGGRNGVRADLPGLRRVRAGASRWSTCPPQVSSPPSPCPRAGAAAWSYLDFMELPTARTGHGPTLDGDPHTTVLEQTAPNTHRLDLPPAWRPFPEFIPGWPAGARGAGAAAVQRCCGAAMRYGRPPRAGALGRLRLGRVGGTTDARRPSPPPPPPTAAPPSLRQAFKFKLLSMRRRPGPPAGTSGWARGWCQWGGGSCPQATGGRALHRGPPLPAPDLLARGAGRTTQAKCLPLFKLRPQ
jgi:hypothetical protein